MGKRQLTIADMERLVRDVWEARDQGREMGESVRDLTYRMFAGETYARERLESLGVAEWATRASMRNDEAWRNAVIEEVPAAGVRDAGNATRAEGCGGG